MDSLYFLIRIVYIVHFIHKPGIAQRKRIRQRNRLSALQREDEVTGIQHIQYRESRRIQLFHIATGIGHRLI